MMNRKLPFLMLCLLLCIAAISQKQTGTFTLAGKITDSKNSPIAGATVKLLNTDYATISDTNGLFSFSLITAGSYAILVQAIGFAAVEKETVVNELVQIQLNETYNQLDAVVVAAEKREMSLQKVPVAVTSLSAKQVNAYRIWNSKDITAIVPNLYMSNSGDNRNVTGIRGITTTSYDPAVATYIDGVNQFSLDTYIGQLFDVERVEVLRGPQGTLYGRNAMGGVINIITKQPTNKTDAFAELNVGNYGRQRYSAGFRTPVIKNKLFMGTSFMYDKMNGYYTNAYNNTDFDKQHAVVGNYYLKYLAGAYWTVTLNAKHQSSRNNGPFPLAASVDDAFADSYTVNQNAGTELVDNVFNTSLSISYTGRTFNFSSQTAYQSNYRYYDEPVDADFSPLDAITIINNYGKPWNNVEAITQEFRFSSPATNKTALKWTAGTYLFYQDNPTKQATHFGKDAPLLGIPDTDFSQINTSKGKRKGLAFFGQGTYTIKPKLDITIGLRYDYEHAKLNVLGQYQKDPDPNPIFDTRTDTTGNAGFGALSPKIGIAYRASKQSTLYASFSRGFRTGGLTQLSSDPSQPPLYQYDPEYSNNFEAGLKNTFAGNRVRINIAAFYTTVENAQVPTLILPDAITVTKNAGSLTSKGFEMELTALPLKGLEVVYNFGYADAAYTTLKVPSNGEEADFSGNKQIFTPDITSMLALQYSFMINEKKGLQLVARGEWMYLGEQYFDLANNIRQSPYNLLNTRIGFSSRHADLFFWMRNITGAEYIAYAYDFGATHLGDPKTYGVTLMVKL